MDAITYFTDPQQIAMANAVKRDDVARIKELARSGVNVNARGDQGMSFLLWAMGNRQKNAFKALLDLGADPNTRDDQKVAVLELTVEDEDLDYLRLLLAAGGNPNLPNHLDEPLIFTAISEMKYPVVRLLVEKGADMNSLGKDKSTPMMLLAGLNQFEEVFWLLQRGADFKKISDTGATLAWRVQRSRVDPGTPNGQWRERVRQFLESQGVKFPVPSPAETLEKQKKD